VKSDRLLHPETLAVLCRAANPSATVRIFSSVGEALNLARQNREATVVVTGSLFLIGEAMHWLGLEPRFSSVTAKEMALQ
jgi:folylpolyglutamate synthase/dihydropteroate synthase